MGEDGKAAGGAGVSRAKVAARAAATFLLGMAATGCILFASAGTFAWPNAWIWLGTLAFLMTVALVALAVREPEALARRVEYRERDKAQRRILGAAAWYFLALFALPGLDRRFGWSEVPPAASLVADLAVAAAYALIVAVMLRNRWAGRTIKVVEGQEVVDTGPYAVVRHPMYAGASAFYLATGVALGSWWAALAGLGVPVILGVRAVAEERSLVRELPGYLAYMEKVRWRIIPGLW